MSHGRFGLSVLAAVAAVLASASLASAQPRLGVRVFSAPGGGVRVYSVQPGSPANGNLLPGNTIITVGGQFITTPTNLGTQLAAAGNRTTLVIHRPGAGFLAADVPLISQQYRALPGTTPPPRPRWVWRSTTRPTR